MSIQEVAARNRALPCRLQGCARNRAAISPYCGRHAKAIEKHGHPLGRAIRRREYEAERTYVARLLERNRSHPAIGCGLRFLAEWLAAASRGEAVPGEKHM